MSEPANTFFLMNRGRFPAAMRTYKRSVLAKTVAEKRRSKSQGTVARRELKKLLDSRCERKYIISRGGNIAITTSVGVTPYALSLLPSLATGANRHTRIGNDISVKKIKIVGRVNLLPYNATTNPVNAPIAVKMWVLSSAAYNEIGAFSGTPAATAFFKSDTTPAGMAGTVNDLTQDVDDENFKVYAMKTIELGLTSATNTHPSTSVQAFDNSNFSAPFAFDVTRYFPKLKYNDTSSSSIPTNRNCWLVIQPVSLDGQSLSVTPVEIHYTLTAEWIDL